MTDGVMTVGSIKATDSRGLIIDVDISVRYQINAAVIPQTISSYGRGWEEMLVNPIVRDVVRDIVADYPAEEIPIKRGDIGAKIEAALAKKFENVKNTPMFFAGSNLREVTLPKKINANITRVQEARQAKERAVQETELAKQNALKVVAIAKGEADKKKVAVDMEAYARVTKAKAEADSIRLKAEAQAEANKKIANSLTAQLVELKNIEAKIELYRNPSLKIVPDNSNMLFGDIFSYTKNSEK
jgi:regulator of protease activity HflC (stomatin/prohibitin superfamily)